jgi:hypothetical protein
MRAEDGASESRCGRRAVSGGRAGRERRWPRGSWRRRSESSEREREREREAGRSIFLIRQ